MGYMGQDGYNGSVRHHKLPGRDWHTDQFVHSLCWYKNSGPSKESSSNQVPNNQEKCFFNLLSSRPGEHLPKGCHKCRKVGVYILRKRDPFRVTQNVNG